MRQAIRVYASVALGVLGVFLLVWWISPFGVTSSRPWFAVLNLVVGMQLWVLFVVPLGVLAGSDAAHAGRRGWLVAFIVLTVLAPVGAQLEQLGQQVQQLLAASCPSGPCAPVSGDPSSFPVWAGWVVATLLVPLAALVYTWTSARHAPSTQGGVRGDSDLGERRLLVVYAILGLVVMSVLGVLANSDFLLRQFASGTVAHILYVTSLQGLLYAMWVTLLLALPIAIASLAMADAARADRRVWLISWIALVVLAVLVAQLLALVATVQDFATGLTPLGWVVTFQQQMEVASVVAPLVVLAVALIYALSMMRPDQHTAARVM